MLSPEYPGLEISARLEFRSPEQAQQSLLQQFLGIGVAASQSVRVAMQGLDLRLGFTGETARELGLGFDSEGFETRSHGDVLNCIALTRLGARAAVLQMSQSVKQLANTIALLLGSKPRSVSFAPRYRLWIGKYAAGVVVCAQQGTNEVVQTVLMRTGNFADARHGFAERC